MSLTCGDLIKRGRALYGAKPALLFEGRQFTFAEQAARMFRLANALLDKGLRKREHVAVLARNCSQYIEIFGACEVAGFVTINLNSRLSDAELGLICQDSQPSVLIYAKEFTASARILAAQVASIRIRIAIDSENNADASIYEDLISEASADEPAATAGANDLAYLMYTSGTTGGPKGVMISHAAMVEATRMLSHESGISALDKALIVMPLFHLGGKIEQMNFNLMGASVVLKAAFEPEDILATIAKEQVTAAHFAPLMIQRMLDVLEAKPYDVSTLRCVHYASAPMPIPLLRRALDRMGPIFVQVYGMTECLVGTALKPHQHIMGDAQDDRRLRSAGQPLLGNEVKIVADDGTACETGKIGEILFRSPTAMRGYWNNKELTAEVLRDGWIHTGDLGFIDDSDFVYVVDRKKDMIISGGENIYSWEVEEALRTHPDVLDVAVIAVPDEVWGESVKACVQMRPGCSARESELIDYTRAKIASYKKPRSIDFVESLPRLFNGKINKKALREPYWRGRDRQVS